ncbi:MAG: adenylate/guanylate cyclase domain-containing protein [Cyclobacteriaceae bacterium]|nr:adenylate/guanylate cyclase domain-containing protein [Cyclobacteriaceae bacterium]MDH4297305.1 adenylate/guanylate cyclase domain-containing protein [Cyclobacteriaceae bacterium]MDH5250636.1 adenylate/guanylate cyclase domain-containing protein [Cyclobacteriaceae bacterium]
MTSTRQLAAIMFTDIVGYTTMMGKDEPKAMEMVRKNREVQKPLIEKHNGSLLKEMGDGNLASFPTASDAIYCAMEIQQALHGDHELNLRIGIHLGEIRTEGGEIYGDGVNVASRLESIADPGGIYISDTVQKAVRSQPDIQTAYLGELTLKNVDYPVKTYAIRGEFLPQPKQTEEKNLSGRLLAELQRRNVIRAELTYLAVAGTVISMLKFVELSQIVEYVIYALLVLGIPLSFYLAWSYERSPEGFVRVTSKKAWINPYSDTQKKPFTGNVIIIILLIIIVGLMAFPKYMSSSIDSVKRNAIANLKRRSIAVLPFDNLSNDPDQLYFSDGIQEDILNHLAKIGDLNVKSRSSTLRYREDRPSIAQIGEEMGVGTILEGSVRKAGNMVRISAQLIDVETDAHIWSETYDRELTEIFAIQSEVAREIARILELKLSSGREKSIFSTGTENITAYDYYLRARELWNNSNYGELNGRIELLQQAILMDPNFAEAYALLSRTLYDSYTLPRGIWLDSALALANKAIASGPEIADGYVVRGIITGNSLGDYNKAGMDFEKAYALEPNNPFVLWQLGSFLLKENEPARGVPMIIQSIELNWSKKDPQYYLQWGDIYRDIGEFHKSRNLYLQAQKLAPDLNAPKEALARLSSLEGDFYGAINSYSSVKNSVNSIDNIAWNYYKAGNLDKAEEFWLRSLEGEQDLQDTTAYFSGRQRLGMVFWKKGEKEKAMKYFNEQIKLNQKDIDQHLISNWGGSLTYTYYDLAITKAYMGDIEGALDIIEHEDISWAGTLLTYYWLDTDPMLDPIRKNPRFMVVADRWRNKAEAAKKVFRQIIRQREAGEELKFVREK